MERPRPGERRTALELGGGLVEVGDPASAIDGLRRAHWTRLRRFSIPTVEHPEGRRPWPLLTVAHAREAMALGRYRDARAADPGALRLPHEIFAAVPPRGLDPVLGLSWTEAAVLCRCAGGRLATEKEAEILLNCLPRDMDDVALRSFWTASPWSAWSYSWCVFDPATERWVEADPRGVELDSEAMTIFELGPPLRRRRVPLDAAPDPRRAAALVFDVGGPS